MEKITANQLLELINNPLTPQQEFEFLRDKFEAKLESILERLNNTPSFRKNLKDKQEYLPTFFTDNTDTIDLLVKEYSPRGFYLFHDSLNSGVTVYLDEHTGWNPYRKALNPSKKE